MICHARCRDNVMLWLCEPFLVSRDSVQLKDFPWFVDERPPAVEQFYTCRGDHWNGTNPKRISHFGAEWNDASYTTQFPSELNSVQRCFQTSEQSLQGGLPTANTAAHAAFEEDPIFRELSPKTSCTKAEECWQLRILPRSWCKNNNCYSIKTHCLALLLVKYPSILSLKGCEQIFFLLTGMWPSIASFFSSVPTYLVIWVKRLQLIDRLVESLEDGEKKSTVVRHARAWYPPASNLMVLLGINQSISWRRSDINPTKHDATLLQDSLIAGKWRPSSP